ncbi:Transporter, drug/metabolite exporter family [Bifidobacterium samirii]|uniref:Transporter, drug/metabolite exporter family n=2 Tax=Bifidobacterium samirii TaxID=2306974 RepID=A0A430FU92_9BIFI|nr:DMT family transporter [Bifidobacterium samirii]RSX56723.1 Transporter, drug/metabolite exporter family [Bifidobacterium samirii]
MACLTLTALIWGFAFVSQVQGMESMTPLFFNASRFTLGALSLIPLLAFNAARRRGEAAQESTHQREDGEASAAAPLPVRLWSNPVVVGVVCGVFLFLASTLQQYGIAVGRSAGRAGFITALYIVMVPLLAFVFLRRRVGVTTLASVAVAVVGFYVLCVTDGFGTLTLADWLLLFTAVLFAAHILVIDVWGSRIDPILLSFVQFATTALLSWAGSLVEGSVDWAGAADAWIAVVYAGLGSVGVAYTLQAVGQRWVPPTRASLIMSLESFFSVVGGALLLGESMTPRGYLGCALIFAGTLLAQLPDDMFARRRQA